nr:hypothetical protein [Tanacetum cinerariifolium]
LYMHYQIAKLNPESLSDESYLRQFVFEPKLGFHRRYVKLDSKEGANDIYKIAKARERRKSDIGNVRYIKDEGGQSILREEDIRKRRGEYFSSLFNESSSIESRPDRNGKVKSSRPQMHYDCYLSRINQGEVRVALQKMGSNKAVGPDQFPMEAWRCLGDEGAKWLTCLFNKIFSSAKMLDEWRLSEVIFIYKNKGDTLACSNYRGIKLLSHTIKLWERVIERMLRRETRVSENQFGFIPGRSTTEAIHLLRSLMEKYRERQRDLHMAFLDLKKAYDRGEDPSTDHSGEHRVFPMEVGLHQGSAISPYLFTLILDELSRGIQESIPWCVTFANDIVLIAESTEGLNNKLERWREVLEDNGIWCWLITKAQANMVEVAELRMMRWTCGKTMVDMIPNGVFRLDVDSIIDKMREERLRWFGHVKRRPQTALVKRVEAMVVKGLRMRGRPKLR